MLPDMNLPQAFTHQWESSGLRGEHQPEEIVTYIANVLEGEPVKGLMVLRTGDSGGSDQEAQISLLTQKFLYEFRIARNLRRWDFVPLRGWLWLMYSESIGLPDDQSWAKIQAVPAASLNYEALGRGEARNFVRQFVQTFRTLLKAH